MNFLNFPSIRVCGGADKFLAHPGRKQAVWTDKVLIFLSGLHTLEQRAKKFIERRVYYAE
jgi:hypothetical protein